MSSARRKPHSPAVDIIAQSPLWQAVPNAEPALRRAIAAAASAVSTSGGELAIVLADDSSVRALNRDWRGKDEPTNVLAFPANHTPPDGPVLLGDVVIAYETTAREAAAANKPFAHHLVHLAVHGFLHLLGYDHESEAQAVAMERLETAILSQLGVPDPYMMLNAGTLTVRES
jgi:probable rRNA maturation factor